MFVSASCSNICCASGADNAGGFRPSRKPAHGLTRISFDRRTKEHPVNAMVTSTHPARLHLRRVPLTAGLAAVSEARAEVRAALLTSELVTNAVQHEADPAVTLAIKCFSGQLRVDVYDTSRAAPVPADAPADAETG